MAVDNRRKRTLSQVKMAPLIIAERRIILFLFSLIIRIVCFYQLDQSGALGMILLHTTSMLFRANFILANIHVSA